MQLDDILQDYAACLRAIRRLYVDSAHQVIVQAPHQLSEQPQAFVSLMEDLHGGLVTKLLTSIAGVDRGWNRPEERLANVLVEHLWNQHIDRPRIASVIEQLQSHAIDLQWSTLVNPFRVYPVLGDAIPQLETLVVRAGNLIAKVDGHASRAELIQLESIQETILDLLRPDAMRSNTNTSPVHEPLPLRTPDSLPGSQAYQRLSADLAQKGSSQSAHAATPDAQPQEASAVELPEALAELDRLIGMQTVKQEVRSLINFLELQRHRREHSLPETNLSLHLVFAGNPGTGKTTVARILGKIFGVMGVLKKGHLVETDRAGLVAEYAGQTGARTNKAIDQALDGILFVDEAYSLVAEEGPDPYGAEAIQVLLKRMEDERERLVVILAGYPEPMDRLLKSNPGLSSRLGRKIEFADYRPRELGEIFGSMCEKYHYTCDGPVRARLLVGLEWLYQRRDQHFGNGRLVRNLFEAALRHLANRIVELQQVDREVLSQFTTDDLDFPDVPTGVLSPEQLQRWRFEIDCPHCSANPRANADLLGRRVRCVRCQETFTVGWGKPVEA
jgi:predicted Zn finger-like uncharacterized protein